MYVVIKCRKTIVRYHGITRKKIKIMNDVVRILYFQQKGDERETNIYSFGQTLVRGCKLIQNQKILK